MPIQIPSIKRAGPVAPTSAGRMDVTLPDTSKAVAMQTEAVGNLVETGAKIVDGMEEQAASVAATAASNEYNVWYRTEAAKLKSIEGDPTEHYLKFDEAAKQYENQLMSKYEGASGRTKAAVSQSLMLKKAAVYDDRMVNEATQAHTYETKVRGAAVDLEKNGLIDAGKVFNVGEVGETKFARIEGHLTEIDKQYLMGGRARGLVKYNEDGDISEIDPILRNEMKKAKSEGLSTLIKSLNSAGELQKAKEIREKYSDYLIGSDKVKLAAGSRSAQIRAESASIAEDLYNLKGEAFEAALDERTDDPEVKQAARAKVTSRLRQVDYGKKQRSTEVYNNLMTKALNAKESGQYVDLETLHSSPEYQQLKDKMLPKQREALDQLYDAPKTSNPTRVEEAMATLTDPDTDLKNMSGPEFYELMGGVSAKDRGYFERMWKDARSETSVEKRMIVNSMVRDLPKALLSAKIVKQNRYGNYDEKNQRIIFEYQQELDKAVTTMPKNLDRGQISQELTRFVAEKANGEIFKWTPQETRKMDGGAKTPVSAAVTKQATGTNLTREQAEEAMAMWKKAHNGFDKKRGDTSTKVKEFYLKNRKAVPQ